MRSFIEFPGWPVIFSLAVLGCVTAIMTSGTLWAAHLLRRRTSPAREVVLKLGLSLVIAWPILVLMGQLWQNVSIPHDLSTHNSGFSSVAEPNDSVPRSIPVAIRPNLTTSKVSPAPVESNLIPDSTVNISSIESHVSADRPVAQFKRENTSIKDISISTPASTSAAMEPLKSFRVPTALVIAMRTLCWVWALGVTVSGIALGSDHRRVRQMLQRSVPCECETVGQLLDSAMRKTGLKNRPRVLFSSEIGCPCIAGMWNPVLVLPSRTDASNDVDSPMMQGFLTHECAHIVRRDVAWSMLTRLIQVVYWWDPGLRRIAKQMAQLREEICDNYVLKSSVDAHEYAKALLDLATKSLMRPLVGVIGMVEMNNPLTGRVERLLQGEPDTATRVGWRSKWGIFLLIILNCGLFGVIGAEVEFPQLVSQYIQADVKTSEGTESIQMYDVPAAPMHRSNAEAFVDHPAPTAPLGTPTEAGSAMSVAADVPYQGEGPYEAGSGVAASPPFGDFGPIDLPVDGDNSEKPVALPFVAPQSNFPMTSDEVVPDDLPGDKTVRPFPVQPPVVSQTKSREVRILEPGTQQERVLSFPVDLITLDLPSRETFQPNDTYALTVTLPAGDHFLPKTIRFEGLVVVATDSIPDFGAGLEPAPGLDSPPINDNTLENPPEPPVAESLTGPAPATPPVVTPPETKPVRFTAPVTVVAAWNFLRNQGVTAAVTKVDTTKGAEVIPSLINGEHLKKGPFDRFRFRITVEALADESGQFNGLRCWGRQLPWETSEHGVGELVKVLERWKADCGKMTNSSESSVSNSVVPNSAPSYTPVKGDDLFEENIPPGAHQAPRTPQLIVDLHVYDNMRYGDVRTIIQACEAQKVTVNVVSNSTRPSPTEIGHVYTSIELSRVYDKKGQPVGNRSLMLAQRANQTETQIITDDHWDQALQQFSTRFVYSSTVLLVKVDPDLPTEALQAFCVKAQRWGVDQIQIQLQSQDLRLRWYDSFVPLIDDNTGSTYTLLGFD